MTERDDALALLDASYNGVLTTLAADGRPVGTPVWSALIDGCLYIRTMAGSAKARRLRADPRCSFVAETGSAVEEIHYTHVSADAVFVEDVGERWTAIVALTTKVRPRSPAHGGPRPGRGHGAAPQHGAALLHVTAARSALLALQCWLGIRHRPPSVVW